MSGARQRALEERLEVLAGRRGTEGARAATLAELRALRADLAGVRREASGASAGLSESLALTEAEIDAAQAAAAAADAAAAAVANDLASEAAALRSESAALYTQISTEYAAADSVVGSNAAAALATEAAEIRSEASDLFAQISLAYAAADSALETSVAADLSSEAAALRSEASAEAAAVRAEFAAADAVVEATVLDLGADIGDFTALLSDEAFARQTGDALLAGRLESLEASTGAANLIDTPVFLAGAGPGAWTGGTGYDAITSTGVFSGFGFPDELRQDDHAVEHVDVAGSFGETTLRASGLVDVPAGSSFPARFGVIAKFSDATPDALVEALIAQPGSAAARFEVELTLPAGVTSIVPRLLSGAAGDAGSVGHEIHWQDLRLVDVTLINAAITAESIVRAAEDAALSTRIDTVEAQAGDNEAAITAEQTARANGDGALAAQITTLQSETAANEAAVTAEAATRASEDGALATQIATVSARTLAAPENLFTKGDFEDGALGEFVLGGLSVVPSAVFPPLTKALRQTERNAYDRAARDIEAPRGETIRFTGRVDASGSANSARIGINFSRVGDAASYFSTLPVATAGDAAKTFSVDVAVPANADRFRMILLIDQPFGTLGQEVLWADLHAENLTDRLALEAAITAEATARTTADDAAAVRLDAVEAEAGANAAAVTAEATARATADSAAATRLDAVEAETSANAAAVTSEAAARTAEDAALAGRIDTVEATAAGNAAAVTSEAAARAAEDVALAGRIDTVEATAGSNAAAITSEAATRASADAAAATRLDTVEAEAAGNAAAITSEAVTRAAADAAAATRLDAVEAEAGANAAAITSESTARASEDAALAGRLDTVEAEAGSNAAAITTETQARVAADSALAGQITGIEATANGTAATLSTDYLTAAQTNSAITSAVTSLQSEMEGPDGSVGGLTADLSANYLTATQTGAAIASAGLNLESRLSGGLSVISRQFLGLQEPTGWGRTSSQGELTISDSDVYPGGYTWTFDVATGEADALFTQSDRPIWLGAANADAYDVEVEFTLVSGALTGVSVSMAWNTVGGQTYVSRHPLLGNLVGPFAIGAPMVARKIMRRPAGFSGEFLRNIVSVNVNDVTYSQAAKVIRIHRVTVRPASAEQLGAGEVGATITAAVDQEAATRASEVGALATDVTNLSASVDGAVSSVTTQAAALAEVEGKLAATYTMRVKAGTSGAQLQLVAADDPEGPASALRVSADDIILNGSVSAPQIAAGAVTANKISVSSLSAISANLGSISVGTANIENLAVNRFKLQDQEITNPKMGTASATKTSAFQNDSRFTVFADSVGDICTVNVNSLGSEFFLVFNAIMIDRGPFTIAFRSESTSLATWDYDGELNPNYEAGQIVSLQGTFYLNPGSRTLAVRLIVPNAASSGMWAQKRSFVAMEMRTER